MLNGVWEQLMSPFLLAELVPRKNKPIRLLAMTVSTGVEKYHPWGMRECFVPELWKKRLSYKTIGF